MESLISLDVILYITMLKLIDTVIVGTRTNNNNIV